MCVVCGGDKDGGRRAGGDGDTSPNVISLGRHIGDIARSSALQ